MKERETSEETIDNKKNRQKILHMCIEGPKRRGEREDGEKQYSRRTLYLVRVSFQNEAVVEAFLRKQAKISEKFSTGTLSLKNILKCSLQAKK